MSVVSALILSRRPASAFVVVGLFWGCFAAYVPVIKAQMGVNDAQFGTLLLGSAFGLVSSMFLAPRVDRLLGERGMQVAAVLLAFVWLFPAQITTPVVFFAVFVGVGLCSGLLDVIMNARVSELEGRTGRSLMNGNHAMFSVAYAIGALVVGAAREGGLDPLWVFGAMGIVTLLIATQLRIHVDTVEPADGIRGRFPLIPILICGGIVLVAFMSEATVEAWAALHVERTLGGGAAEGALGPAMLGVTMAIGRFSGQVVSEKLREVSVILWASLISASGAIVAALAPTPMVAYVGFGMLGLGVSVIGPMGLALVGKLVAAHHRTEAISKAAVMGFSGFFLAPVLMGYASQAFGLRVAFACVALLLVTAVPLSLLAARLRATIKAG